MRLRVRVQQQLVRVEAVADIGLVGSVDAEAVDPARTCVRQIAVEDLVRIFRKLDALYLPFTLRIEDAKFHFGGSRREDGEVDAEAIPCGPQGIGSPGLYPGAVDGGLGRLLL